MSWTTYYPAFSSADARDDHASLAATRSCLSKEVTVADIGCGYGGLLVALGPKLEDEILLGALVVSTVVGSS